MAITKADILWYWDHIYGNLAPVVGGQPVFARAGNAFVETAEAFNAITGQTTPRFEPDGLRLELAQTNLVIDPFNVNGSSASWSKSASLTKTAVTSIFEGETAYKYINASGSSQSLRQAFGTLTGSPEASFVVVENFGANTVTQLGIFDGGGSAGFVAIIRITWSTGAVTVDSSPQGSSVTAGRKKIADIGPNGGPVYLIWFIATPNDSGSARTCFIYPGSTSTTTTGCIIHAAQHVEAGLFTSPVEGTRPIEIFYWNNPPLPQGMIVYCKFLIGSAGSGGLASPRVWGIDDGDPRVMVFWSTAASITYHFDNNIDAAKQAGISISPSPGDLIELVNILFSDGAGRMISRKNGAAVQTDTFTAPASGLPSAWASDRFTLNNVHGGTSPGANQFQQMKAVTVGSVDSATDGTGTGDEDLMAEMAALVLTPDGEFVSNAI